MATVASTTSQRTYRLAALSAMSGILLILGSTFFPGVIRIIYQSRAGCPNSPECPPPYIDASTYWDGWIRYMSGPIPLTFDMVIGSFLWLAPFLAFFIVQAVIAWHAWRGQLPRTPPNEEVVAGMATMMIFGGRPRLALLKGGIVASVVALILFLGSSFFLYCLFFCGSGIPLPGEYRESGGLWQSSGVRYLAPGFWLALGGYLLSLITDVTLLIGVRRTLRQSG
jgi:hypothetical protein